MTTPMIPDEALDADIAILGRKGGGKTYTAKGIVERLLDMGRRVLILDPLGVWAGLRTGADGETPGYPIAIFGGIHGDLPLDPAAAAPLARIIAAENLPAVIDLSELSKSAQQSFLLAFLHELRRVNHDALTIVLEEGDVFAPQNPQGDDSKALHGEVDWIARRGRSRGFRLITVTQRPARLSKDVLTQCSTLIAHRLPSPQDRDAIKAWVDGNGDRDKAREVFDTLAGLAVGEAWVWAPEHDILSRMRFPAIRTLDTSSTPKAGESRVEPKTLAQVDLSGIKAALAASAPAPKEGARRALQAIGETAAKMKEQLAEAEHRGYMLGLVNGEIIGRKIGADSMRAALRAALDGIEIPAGSPVSEATVLSAPAKRADPPDGFVAISPAHVRAAPSPSGLNSAATKMLAVLDTDPPVRRSWSQAATLAGLKARGGHFNAGRRALIDGGLVREIGGMIEHASPTPGARPPRSPAEIVDLWAGVLSGAAPKILRRLFEVGGSADREAIASDLGMLPRGGHWNSGWKELRDNELIETDGKIAKLSRIFNPND